MLSRPKQLTQSAPSYTARLILKRVTRLDDGATIESGTVVPAAQLVLGDRYNVVWDYQGEAGREDMWKFRGGSEDTVRMMEEDMARDPNAQVFHDMVANYQAIGSVLQPHQPRLAYDSDDDDEIIDYYPRAVGKWNAIFARAKANNHTWLVSHCFAWQCESALILILSLNTLSRT
ncbi:hypothetical protein C8J57DRAFT_1642902 [Mycena rebaudengoi]|nr:hypothetical protein C8J57DRAFT_1642902 [Mycena rebaudengoi]